MVKQEAEEDDEETRSGWLRVPSENEEKRKRDLHSDFFLVQAFLFGPPSLSLLRSTHFIFFLSRPFPTPARLLSPFNANEPVSSNYSN